MRYGRWASRDRRRAGLLVIGLAGGLGILAATPAAAAVSGTINSPANGASYATAQKLAVDATVSYGDGDSGTATLTATDPDYTNSSSTGCVFTVGQPVSYTGSNGGSNTSDVSGTLDLGAAYPKSCPAAFQGKPAVNGKWMLTLTTGAGTSVASYFTAAVPPATPAGVKGSSASPMAVTITWTPNPELDTHAYAVLNAQGDVIAGPTDATSACSATACSASFTVAQSGAQSFAVRAYRYTSPPKAATSSTAGDLTADSADQTVAVMAKPAPSSSPPSTPGGGGATSSASPTTKPSAAASKSPGEAESPTPSATTSASASANPTPAATSRPGPSTSAKTVTIQLHNTASGAEAKKISAQFQNFAAPAGIDKLPPLPKLTSAGTVTDLTQALPPGEIEPTDPGTFKVSLGYAPQTKTLVTHTTKPGTSSLSFVSDAIGISPDALWESLAGSLVLLLCAGHVRRWARQPIE